MINKLLSINNERRKEIICHRKYKLYKKSIIKKNQKEFIIFNTPLHGNIGDHAIIYAEEKLLSKYNISFFEIPTIDEKYYYDYVKNNASKDAIIAITGGGFIGSEWLLEEELVNKVVNDFKHHKIIVFPQTVYFKNDEIGEKELKKSISIFNNADDVYFFAREKYTYDFVKEKYTNVKVMLVPDIVLSLNYFKSEHKRDRILLCLRKDVEGILDLNIKKQIYDFFNKKGLLIEETDMVLDKNILENERESVILNKLNEFAHSKLVITDRLHGMIFSAITNTPCIALNNYNYKVKGVYEYISSYFKNIIMLNDINQLQSIERTLFYENNYVDCSQKFKNLFNDLYNIIQETF